ncbi:MAG: rhomboid family intramembrane serine protease [Planctomycetes bacterium]|nr:rhomboid family intramembrane serine protease [Planctomycetota bacterium]
MTAYVCGRCGSLVEQDARRCVSCGRLWPALFGLRPVLDRVFSPHVSFSKTLALALVIIYLAMTLVAQKTGDVAGAGFDKFTAGPLTLVRFGAMYNDLFFAGDWWRPITACLLHAGVLHVLFNVAALFQIGPLIEHIYGPARFTIMFLASGVVGYVAGLPFVAFTMGASGAICGMIGALIGYGYQRGGAYGEAARRQGIQWLIYVALFGFLVPGVNNYAHFGGAAAGYVLGRLFDIRQMNRGRESDGARLAALVCLALVLAACGLAAHSNLADS